jgi:phytoene dehydrogenase-like protein
MNESTTYDAIVIGAGTNGLTCAASLALRGRRVLVVERRPIAGGLAAGEEFHPGYRTAGVLFDTCCLRQDVADALHLQTHGLQRASGGGTLLARTSDDGDSAPQLQVLPDELDIASEHLSPEKLTAGQRSFLVLSGLHFGLSRSDAGAMVRFRRFIAAARGALGPLLTQVPPRLGTGGLGDFLRLAGHGWALRRMGRVALMDLLRVIPLSAADWLGEYFESDVLKAALCAPALHETWMGPRSAGSAFNLLLREVTAGAPVAGGPSALAEALLAAARAAGVEIRTSAPVSELCLQGDKVRGVRLQDGQELQAPIVAASCDPKQTLLGLVPGMALGDRLRHHMQSFRARGTSARVHLALRGPLLFDAAGGQVCERVRVAGGLDALERAFDAVKYRRMPERPVLEVYMPTVSRPDLAPPGHHVASLAVHFVPFELDGGWTAQRRRELGDLAVAELARHAPGVHAVEVAREVLTPADLAERYGLTGGHLHHGEHALDQLLVRPAPECARYATSIAGLFLCGGGSWPGGGLTCAPGYLAAKEVLGTA